MHKFNRVVGKTKKKHKLYHRWINLKKLVNDPKCDAYFAYGGRGIKMCQEWSKSYPVFLLWCIQNGYEKDLILTRINKGGDFEPSNCKFVVNTHDTTIYQS
jgi:hypothetical protein